MSGERIRSLKPEWLDDEKLAATSDTARMMSVALILLSDDHGRGRGNKLFLASRIYPYSSRDPRETLATLSGGLQELCDCGFLRLYQVSGQDYFEIINWRKHQRVDKPGKPRVPEPPANVSGDPRETLAPDLGSGSGILDQGARTDDERANGPSTTDPERRVSKLDVRLAWNLQAQHHGLAFGAVPHDAAWETIAEACNAKPKPPLALDTLCAWLWTAPDGPVKSGRVQASLAKPERFVADVNADLSRAWAWLRASQQQPQEAHEQAS